MIKVAGIASGMGARDKGAAMGVWDIFYNCKLQLDWQDIFFAKSNFVKLEAMQDIFEINTKMANCVKNMILSGHKSAFFSGDHSGAMGIWSGVAEAKRPQGDIGLIWIDAHLDSHTPQSSATKNIHGMPMAYLLGQGDFDIYSILSIKPKLKPENVCFIGTRSFEAEEQALIEKLGCKIFYIADVLKLGITDALKEAHKIVTKNTVGFGISFDIDAFDPSIAPGTGYIENNGLIFDDNFSDILKQITNEDNFLAAEISEYFPYCDQDRKTAILIEKILKSCYLINE